MKNIFFYSLLTLSLGLTCTKTLAQKLAFKAEQVYTMSSPMIKNGLVLVKDGKIEWVGEASKKAIPKDYKVYATKVLTPGLIDAHSTVGLSGALNQPHDQDHLETSGSPISPELRALDAYNSREVLVEYLRNYGVTTLHTGHGLGALMAGQTMIVKTQGGAIQQALVDSSAMVAMTMGPDVASNFKSPGTRAKGMAMLRQELIKAQSYLRKTQNGEANKRPDRDLKMETLAQLLKGELKALITVNTAHDILTAIRLSQEFGLKLVLDGAAEAYLVLDEIKASGAEVILHPTMQRASGDRENISFETAKVLHEASIPFSLQSSFEGYVPKTRIVLFEAAVAAGYGLPFEAALAAITRNPAKLLGISHRVGSLEAGKDADLVGFDGDPFEYTSHVCTVVLNGQIVSETCR